MASKQKTLTSLLCGIAEFACTSSMLYRVEDYPTVEPLNAQITVQFGVAQRNYFWFAEQNSKLDSSWLAYCCHVNSMVYNANWKTKIFVSYS